MALFNNGILKILIGEESLEIEKRERSYPFSVTPIFETTIVDAIQLTENSEDVKEIYDITLDLRNVNHRFLPGDTIGILPHNDKGEVDEIVNRLNCKEIADKKCFISTKSKKCLHIPSEGTIREIFLNDVDIRAPPKKTFLKLLSQHSNDDKEIGKLKHLSSPAGSRDYNQFLIDEGYSLLSVLKSFPSCSIPVDLILENLPPLQPRPYSISSSPLNHNLHVTFSLITLQSGLNGVCSSYLKKSISRRTEKIRFYFRKSNLFRLPEDLSRSIVMIGPGTAVAPFIGFLEHLLLVKKQVFTWLFFGCRYEGRDFIFRDRLTKFLDEGCLSRLSVAFSRDQEEKIHVTDLIRRDSKAFYDLLQEGCVVFVCGDAKDMMRDVRESVLWVLRDNGVESEDVEARFDSLVSEGRYIEDRWL